MSELKPCPFCGSDEVGISFTPGEEDWYVKCSKCGSRGIRSEDTAKCIASWNKRLGDILEPKSALVILAPRMYQLLKEYVGIIEEYVSIYDNFPEDLQDIATQAQELLDRVVEECEE